MDTKIALRLKTTGLWVAIAAAVTVGGALVLQYVFGYAPCKLCLTERLPYYAAVPSASSRCSHQSASLASLSASPLSVCSTARASASITRAPNGASGRARWIAAVARAQTPLR